MKTASPSEHDQRVREFVPMYVNWRYDVFADLPGFKLPPVFGGFRPDIVAIDNRDKVIAEIETEEGLMESHTVEQLTAFSNARKDGYKFHLLVPKESELAAKLLCSLNDIEVDQWWFYV
jgi:hypothetical protein